MYRMDYDFAAILAKNIKRIRNKLNISQMELALRAGVSIAFINSIENRQKWVSAKTLSKLTAALGVLPYELFLTDDIKHNDLQLLADHHKEMITDIQDILRRYTKDVEADIL